MPDSTNSNLKAITATSESHTDRSPVPSPSTRYLCTSCHMSFRNGQEQRFHMKKPLHVYNIKRRIASLPPIPREEFALPVEKKGPTSISTPTYSTYYHSSDDDKDDDEISGPESEPAHPPSPYHCLFCTHISLPTPTGLTTNLTHMRTTHNLFLPSPTQISDLQSFLEYLATEVHAWHECLYCGAIKDSTRSVQSHMRDKGHCALNLEREPGLVGFWEEGVEINGLMRLEKMGMEEGEVRLEDGRIVEGRLTAAASANRQRARRRNLVVSSTTTRALPPQNQNDEDHAESSSPPNLALEPHQLLPSSSSSGRQLARRDEMSITGVSAQQRQALVVAEKKAQRSEAVARRAREWVVDRGGNFQKWDQVDGKMKAGKQNHKLQPR